MASLLDFANDQERQALVEIAAARGMALDDLLQLSQPAVDMTEYERFKRRQVDQSRRASLSGRDIGSIPTPIDPARRADGMSGFRRFCEIYMAERFTLAWSADHLKAIERIETSARNGGLFSLAMPRGNGKTTLAEAAAIWTIATGLRRFVLIVGSTAGAAKEILKSIKTELETNDLLFQDFPELCHPIRSLEGIANKCKGQLHRGRQTHIEWGSKHVVCADIPGAPCSQAIIKVGGLLGADVRGSKHKMSTGAVARPDFVILDDPQTDKSARSEVETRNRKRVVNGALLGVAGPGCSIAGVMPCTVIRRGDLADSMLDRKQSPHWHGERFKMLPSMPTNQKLLDEYAERRAAELSNGGDGSISTEFWRENQAAIEAGGVASWPERKLPGEVSAIQHAINLRLRDAYSFDAEYQNEPQDQVAEADLLTAEQITKKQGSTERGRCPITTQHVTAFIDVQDDALFWLAVGWSAGFGGTVLDYGVYPEIHRSQFRLLDLSGLLTRTFPGLGQEARWHKAIVQLGSYLATREWQREDGTVMRAAKILVDSAYGKSTDTVYEAVKSCSIAAVQCSRGKYYGAGSLPMSDMTSKPGRRMGVHWFDDKVDNRSLRCVTIDTNFWKSFVQARLSTPVGDRGSLSLYKAEPYRHSTLSEHLTAEYRTKTFGRGREVDEWKQRPERPDNHWLDCLVGCAVGASMQGLQVEGGKAASRGAAKVADFAAMQRAARAKRDRQ